MDSEKSESADCSDCGKPVQNEQQGIKCTNCALWIHSDCITKSENQAGVDPKFYKRMSQRKYEFYCPRCKSKEAPTFLQSLFNVGLIKRQEVIDEELELYIRLEEEPTDGAENGGQGDASFSRKQKLSSTASEFFVDLDPLANTSTSFYRAPNSSPLVPGPSRAMNTVKDAVQQMTQQMENAEAKHDKERKDDMEQRENDRETAAEAAKKSGSKMAR